MSVELKPFTREELWQAYDKSGSINKHLLIIYSLAIGVYAQRALDLGVGYYTNSQSSDDGYGRQVVQL